MKHVVGRARDLEAGGRMVVEVGGRSIGVFNVDGRFYALRNRCPHQGGPLCLGRISGLLRPGLPGEYVLDPSHKVLRCPWHGWEFDLDTGRSWFDPAATRVRSYDVEVVPAAALAGSDGGGREPAGDRLPGPYVADTYPVTVEDEYLVVDLGR
jgi:3-phenylpropionate/trans-cinnamate dioxygenase ferredoxin subunit